MSEVITKRLMTDDTGQEIVGALEDLALAVKPTGAEIDMSSTDTTKVKDAIETNSQAITNLTKTLHGATVSLDSYTSSDYTFTSDGILVATCESSATAKAIVQIKDSSGNNFAKLGGWGNSTYATYSCYVKKGMKARVITLENSGHVNFEPFA